MISTIHCNECNRENNFKKWRFIAHFHSFYFLFFAHFPFSYLFFFFFCERIMFVWSDIYLNFNISIHLFNFFSFILFFFICFRFSYFSLNITRWDGFFCRYAYFYLYFFFFPGTTCPIQIFSRKEKTIKWFKAY